MTTMFNGISCADLYDRSVAAFRQSTAILFNDEKYTYDDLQKNAYSLANALNKLGLKKGDRVGFLMGNCPEYIYCEYALGKLGMVRVPLAALLNSKDHIYMSLERMMKCGVGKCGHCAIGDRYCCIDGPVFPYTEIENIKEAI